MIMLQNLFRFNSFKLFHYLCPLIRFSHVRKRLIEALLRSYISGCNRASRIISTLIIFFVVLIDAYKIPGLLYRRKNCSITFSIINSGA